MYARLFLILLALFSLDAKAQTIQESVAFAIIGEPKYAAGFSHFDYVNPRAPKGGTLTLAAIGTFDNFNRYALRGNPAVRTEALYDTLFTTSDDEPGSYYPLIAERARYAEDYSWMEIALNPRARFHDGTPITARDVAFTFNKFMTEGVPQFRLFYKGTTVKAIAPLTVRIDLGQPGKENMLSLLSLPVMPEAFWRQHKLSDPLSKPPLASGPYRISAWRMGQYLPIPGSPTTGRPTCRSTAVAGISIRCAMTIISTTMSLSKPLKREPSIAGKRPSPKTGLPATSVATSAAATSLKMSIPIPRRRIPSGWRSIFSARFLPIAGCGRPLPWRSISNG